MAEPGMAHAHPGSAGNEPFYPALNPEICLAGIIRIKGFNG